MQPDIKCIAAPAAKAILKPFTAALVLLRGLFLRAGKKFFGNKSMAYAPKASRQAVFGAAFARLCRLKKAAALSPAVCRLSAVL